MDKARSLLRKKRLVAETDSKHGIIPNSDEYSEGKKGITPGGGDLGPALSKGLSETCVRPGKTWGRGDLVGDESEGRAPGQESTRLGAEPLTHPQILTAPACVSHCSPCMRGHSGGTRSNLPSCSFCLSVGGCAAAGGAFGQSPKGRGTAGWRSIVGPGSAPDED